MKKLTKSHITVKNNRFHVHSICTKARVPHRGSLGIHSVSYKNSKKVGNE